MWGLEIVVPRSCTLRDKSLSVCVRAAPLADQMRPRADVLLVVVVSLRGGKNEKRVCVARSSKLPREVKGQVVLPGWCFTAFLLAD